MLESFARFPSEGWPVRSPAHGAVSRPGPGGGAVATHLSIRSVAAFVSPLDVLSDRLHDEARLAVVLLGGVVAVWTLFVVGTAVWSGRLPPGTVLLVLLAVFLLVAAVVPTPEPEPDPQPHEVWQQELDEDGDDHADPSSQ